MEFKKIIVAGISTDTGKTVASAILCRALKADYWKPVQAGDLHNTDSHKIKRWSPTTSIQPEAYRLTSPMSPHAAADIDTIQIEESALSIPMTNNQLVIELAGGLMVPLRNDYLIIDWVANTGIPVVLVSNYYLGSINHTLLSWEALMSRGIPVLGIIFNGEKNDSTFDVILKRTQANCLLEIKKEKEITPEIISNYAARFTL